MKYIKMLIVHGEFNYTIEDDVFTDDSSEYEEVSDEDYEMYKKLVNSRDKYHTPRYFLVEKPKKLTLKYFADEIKNLQEFEEAKKIKDQIAKEKRDEEAKKRAIKDAAKKAEKEKKQLEKLTQKLGVKIVNKKLKSDLIKLLNDLIPVVEPDYAEGVIHMDEFEGRIRKVLKELEKE